uniref:Uncharacterized protein n=1 Tax=Avena sativa TaxID=4498 RepID=A0ACD6A9N7_AVESA
MANMSIQKPEKRLTGKRSSRFGLPLLCGQSDAASPVPRSSSSSSSPSSRRSSGNGNGSGRKSELRRIFQHFDRDNDGKISGAELSAFFASMGDDLQVPSSASGGYLLDFAGFVALMERGESSQEEDLRRAFEVFNAVEPAGRITARGLRRVLAQLGDERSVADCEAMIRAYDVDGDGGLDFHEFQRMMS